MLKVGIILLIVFILLWWFIRPGGEEKENDTQLDGIIEIDWTKHYDQAKLYAKKGGDITKDDIISLIHGEPEALSKIVAKDVANKRIQGEPYDVISFMLNIHDQLIQEDLKEDHVLMLIAKIPELLINQVIAFPPNGSYLSPVLGLLGEFVSKCIDHTAVHEILNSNA